MSHDSHADRLTWRAQNLLEEYRAEYRRFRRAVVGAAVATLTASALGMGIAGWAVHSATVPLRSVLFWTGALLSSVSGVAAVLWVGHRGGRRGR